MEKGVVLKTEMISQKPAHVFGSDHFTDGFLGAGLPVVDPPTAVSPAIEGREAVFKSLSNFSQLFRRTEAPCVADLLWRTTESGKFVDKVPQPAL
jgi:hypothetical protein